MSGYLIHYGILGQKWGIRRFQNEDGTLTSAGRKRYFNDKGGLTRHGLREFNKLNEVFMKTDQHNTKQVANERDSEVSKEIFKALNDVKKADPNIGAVITMNNGVSYTSREAEKAASEQNLYAVGVRWLCYGETLEKTIDMIDTTMKYSRDEKIQSIRDLYQDKLMDAMLTDINTNTEAAKEFLKARRIT